MEAAKPKSNQTVCVCVRVRMRVRVRVRVLVLELLTGLTSDFLTVLGKFLSKLGTKKRVAVGKPLRLRCPPRSYTFGAKYYWTYSNRKFIPFLDKPRVLPLPNGDLLFSYVTDEDIGNLSLPQGLRCRMEHLHPPYEGSISESSALISFLKDGGKSCLAWALDSILILWWVRRRSR